MLPRRSGGMLQYSQGNMVLNRTRPRTMIPSTPPSKREKQHKQEGGSGPNSASPSRIIPSTFTSKRKSAAVYSERQRIQ